MKTKECAICSSKWHYKTFCPQKPRKAIKKQGKEAERWKEYRDNTVIPYLDKKYGKMCRCCKRTDLPLDVDHIHPKGSHPQLKYQISNFQYLCRFPCHVEKTAGKECKH